MRMVHCSDALISRHTAPTLKSRAGPLAAMQRSDAEKWRPPCWCRFMSWRQALRSDPNRLLLIVTLIITAVACAAASRPMAGPAWVISAYLLPLSAVVLLGRAAGDRFGRLTRC